MTRGYTIICIVLGFVKPPLLRGGGSGRFFVRTRRGSSQRLRRGKKKNSGLLKPKVFSETREFLPNGQKRCETGTDARNGRILVCAAYFCTQAGRNLVVTKQVCRYRAVSGFPGTTRRRQQNRDGGFEPLGGCAPRLPLGRLLSHIP